VTTSARLLCAGLQERVEELKQVMLEDKSTKDMLKVGRASELGIW